MLAAVINDGSVQTITTPASGWTLLETMPVSGMDFSAWLYGRVKQTGDGNPTWIFSGGAWHIVIAAYSGVSTIDDTSQSTVTVADVDIATADVSPVSADDMLVVVGLSDAAAPARTWTETGTMTERFEGIGQTLHCLVADEQLSGGAGSPVSRVLTISGTTQQLGAFAVALAPAAAPAGPSYNIWPVAGRKWR
jgi:hypothetical protein